MDLQHPEQKMSKSATSPLGTISIDDPPGEIDRKIRRAVTDAETEVRYDRDHKPGVANLLELLAAATGEPPARLAARYDTYGALKADVAAAVVELLRPVRASATVELARDTGALAQILRQGADQARRIAAVTLGRAQRAVGLVPGEGPRSGAAGYAMTTGPMPTMRPHHSVPKLNTLSSAPGTTSTRKRTKKSDIIRSR